MADDDDGPIIEREANGRYALTGDELPSLTRALREGISASLVREYMRGSVVEPVIRRLFNIGMGVQKFDTPTKTGSIVRVEARPSVQVKALGALLSAAVPNGSGIEGSDPGEELPGVWALGPLGLDEARRVAHGDRYLPMPSTEFVDGVPVPSGEPVDPIAIPSESPDGITPGLDAREGYEVVELEEEVAATTSDDQEPGPIKPAFTLEQIILARRRRKRSNGNGNGNGRYNGNGGNGA